MNTRARMARGLTLVEVLFTVIIVGILAAVAVPNYQRAVNRGYWRAAQDVLRTIYAGEQVYFETGSTQDYRDGLSAASPLADWRQIYTDNPNSGPTPVDYSVPVSPPGTFTAQADRGGQVMTIDQDNTLDTSGWPEP